MKASLFSAGICVLFVWEATIMSPVSATEALVNACAINNMIDQTTVMAMGLDKSQRYPASDQRGAPVIKVMPGVGSSGAAGSATDVIGSQRYACSCDRVA